MIYDHKKNNVAGINIAYIGGGSRAWANVLMIDLAREKQLSGTVKLYDIDYEAACENAAVGNRTSARDDVPGKWKYETTQSLPDALKGADFVVISILPGTFEEMRSDVHEPEKYGIYQPVGDTTGPGGIIRALRTIPLYIEFAENIKKYCPDAWVINYTNPMALCVRTLYEVFPKIKAFGCCHEVFSTQLDVANMVDKHLGVQGAKKHDIKVNVLGINHFTWLDKISYKGFDLMPLYDKIANEYSVEGYVRENNAHRKNSVFRCSNAVKFDLYRRFGVAAAAGDRHLVEFMPSSRYLKDLQTIERWGFALTPVDWRIEDRKEVNKKRKRRIDGLDELELHDTGEEGVLQLKAILGLGDYVTNVNMPNVNQLCGITPGAVVETNAYISKDSVQPICSGRLPWDVHNMVSRHSGNQEAVLEAAMTGNKTLAFNAFINDPLVDWIDIGDAKKLFDVMIENTKAYLPNQWGW